MDSMKEVIATHKLEKKTVFLADSCEISGNLLSEILFREGYEIFRFKSGNELLESLRNGAYPDLLLIGTMLPGMSGLELLGRMNSAKIKLVTILIGYSYNINDVLLAYRYGAVDFIMKPLDLKEVLMRVKLSLERVLSFDNTIGTA
jgi:DNA-binding response OmpR family regulator